MQVSEYDTFVRSFRESAPYLNRYRGETFVIVLDEQTLSCANATAIIHDIALLNTLGIRLVLVCDIPASKDSSLVPVSQAVLKTLKAKIGSYRFELEAIFSCSLPNTPMHGADLHVVGGNLITARPLGVIDGTDFQFAGRVRKIEAAVMNQMLTNDQLILLANLAYSSTGECFYLEGGAIASEVAKTLRASKVIAFANTAELNAMPRELLLSDIDDRLEKHHRMIHVAAQACRNGIERAQVIPFDKDGSLLTELFTRDGVGTLVSENPFEIIEAATIADVGGIMALLAPLEEEGILVKRDRERLEQEIGHFIVIKRDDMVIATSALYPFANQTAEIACVATHPEYRGHKRAERMMNFLERKAMESGIRRLFVLTTQSTHFFQDNGFIISELSALPEEKQHFYNFRRNSRVLLKVVSGK